MFLGVLTFFEDLDFWSRELKIDTPVFCYTTKVDRKSKNGVICILRAS